MTDNATVARVVYVPNKDARLDYSAAYDFGHVMFCTEGELNRKDVTTMHSALSSALAESEPDDYILIGSLATVCAVACAVFAKTHGRLNLLLYERGKYIERSITL